MSTTKPNQGDAELSDQDLDNVTGGTKDHILTLDGIEGESQTDRPAKIDITYTPTVTK